MSAWNVILTQPDTSEPTGFRSTVAAVWAADIDSAVRQAQRSRPGWTAVLVEQLAEAAA